MFKKLKDKIAEEVKQSPRFQEIINSAQVSLNTEIRYNEKKYCRSG